jgi:hypothetical protein
MRSNVYISTGQKEVFYTLWMESTNPPFDTYFIKNLSLDKETAVKEAKKYAEENEYTYDGIYSSPKHKRTKSFERFGITFTHKRKHGKSFFMGFATPEFWEEWRANKEEMKKSGFRVSKFIDRRHDNQIIWYVFFRDGEN